MRGAPEILCWPSAEPAVVDHEDGERPVGDWIDFGDLGQLGAGERGAGLSPEDVAAHRGPATKVVWAVVVLAALAALVVPALHSPAAPVEDPAVRTDTHPPAYPDWEPPAPLPSLPQLMVLAAHNPRPLTDVVRPGWTRGGCPRPQPHAGSPITRAMSSVAASMPGFRLVDSSRLTDQFGELCLVQLRARNAKGTIIVVNVIPPQQWPGIHTEPLVTLESAGHAKSFARTVSETSPTGWRIEVGAVGSPAKLPTLLDLSAVSDDPRLTW